jgi:hypothetical protein
VARGYYNLADVIAAQKGDLVKAEQLARESLRIRVKFHGNNHHHVGNVLIILSLGYSVISIAVTIFMCIFFIWLVCILHVEIRFCKTSRYNLIK